MAAKRGKQLGEPCSPGAARPLRIVAHLAEGIVLNYALQLDGLLAWAVAAEMQLPPPIAGMPCPAIEIPIQREPAGRFHLCSEGCAVTEASELRWKQRRPVQQQLARLGAPSIMRADTAAGANKAYRSPYELQLLQGDRIEWWCLGDAARIERLLGLVHYLGKHRGSGKGRLDLHRQPWLVAPCEPWDGFPVLRGGKPLRVLPLDWPGLVGHRTSYRVLTPPYWDRSREEMLACP